MAPRPWADDPELEELFKALAVNDAYYDALMAEMAEDGYLDGLMAELEGDAPTKDERRLFEERHGGARRISA